MEGLIEMKKNLATGLLVIETILLILILLFNARNKTAGTEDSEGINSDRYRDMTVSDNTELLREASPAGDYTLLITRIAEPDFPFGEDHLQITLFEVIPEGEAPRAYYRTSFQADVANDGAPAAYQIEWLEEGVQIALTGSEQPTAYYILPFKGIDE